MLKGKESVEPAAIERGKLLERERLVRLFVKEIPFDWDCSCGRCRTLVELLTNLAGEHTEWLNKGKIKNWKGGTG